MNKQRLTKHDWLAAGFRALAREGTGGLKAEAIARDLKTTKGSFYWHFKDITAFRTDMLQLWQHQATQAIIQDLTALPAGLDRLRALVDYASHTPTEYGGKTVEPAIRDWARQDPQAHLIVTQVDQARIAFVETELAAIQINDPVTARLFYAAHLGLEQLGCTTKSTGLAERRQLLALLVRLNP